jgi:hypothetical protein
VRFVRLYMSSGVDRMRLAGRVTTLEIADGSAKTPEMQRILTRLYKPTEGEGPHNGRHLDVWVWPIHSDTPLRIASLTCRAPVAM